MTTENLNRSYRSIALVDLSYLFKMCFVMNPDGPPRAAAEATIAKLNSIRDSVDHVILCLDYPPYKRKQVYPQYKAKRPEPLPQERAQKRWLFSEVQRLGYPCARSEGHEADDCIATLCRHLAEWCADVRIYSNDKDAAQCVNDQCIQYIPAVGDRKEQRRSRLEVKVKFGVYPEQIPLFLALMGDATDNVPGVPSIGEKTAARLVTEHRTLVGLAEALGTGGQKGAYWSKLAAHWNDLKLSLDLVTLDTNVPLDVEALLVRPVVTLDQTSHASMDVALDGFEGNHTPAPQNENAEWIDEDDPEGRIDSREYVRGDEPGFVPPEPIIGADPNAAEKLLAAERERNADRAAREQQDEALRAAGARPEVRADVLESRPGRLAITEAEFIPFGPQATQPAAPPPPKQEPAAPKAPAPANSQGATSPAASAAPEPRPALAKATVDYGRVTEDLQPLDLRSARTVTEWLHSGGLYPQFQGPATLFTIIARGKELGLGMTTALSAFHVIEGKPSASADLIRALAMRDPDCEYFYCKVTSSTRSVWVTKHRKNPEPQEYEYTLAEAEAAGLVVPSRNGKPSNWMTRPRDMLAKTAGSKLARLVYPAATMGLYCPEELSQEYPDEAAA